MKVLGMTQVVFLLLCDSVLLLLYRNRGHRDKDSRRKVLIIRLDAIGDFVLWLDSVRALRGLYPSKQFEITLLANALWTSLANDIGAFDVVWPLDRKKLIWNPFYRFKLLLKIRKAGFDQVLHPTFSRETCFGDSVVRISGSLTRIGSQGDFSNNSLLAKRITDRWYTKLLPIREPKMMELRRHAEFIHYLGCPTFRPSIPQLKVQYDFPMGFTHKKYYVVVPGAGAQYRQWPLENFARTAKCVYDLTGLTAVVCGDTSETLLAKRLARFHPDLFHDWAGKTSLNELVAIIEGAEFVLSNETSAVHIAAALQVPSVCILGGGHFGRFLPYDIDDEKTTLAPYPVYVEMNCFNCNWICRYSVPKGRSVPCIENVGVAEVLKEIRNVLKSMGTD